MRKLDGAISELLSVTKDLYEIVVETLEESSCLTKDGMSIEACKKANHILAVFDNWKSDDDPCENLTCEEISHMLTCIKFRIIELDRRLDRLILEKVFGADPREMFDSIQRAERELKIYRNIEKQLMEKDIL